MARRLDVTRRIVQLTDCHLFADPQQTLRDMATWPRMTATLRYARRLLAEADLVVLTGDTAHDESRDTYLAVRRLLQDSLGPQWSSTVRVIPGNHDDREAVRELLNPPSPGPADRVTFQIQWPDWRVIGLDSQLPGEVPGALGAQQLDWLETQLEQSPLPTLLFLHHPPIAVQSSWLDKIGLRDAPALESLLSRYPHARLVVCGHVHQECAGSLGHAAAFTTPAVGPQFQPRTDELVIAPKRPAFRLIELDCGGRWSTQVLHCEPEV